MNAIKERILGAITVMNNSDAEKVWDFMVNNLHPRSWDEIEEITPDDWDLKMLDDMDNNPDRTLISCPRRTSARQIRYNE